MQAFNLQAFNKYRLQYRRFPVKFVNFLRTPFFTEYLRWLLLANGVPYLVKLQVTFFIKKLNFIHPWFLPQFKKSFISEKPFAEHIFLQAAYWNIENRVSPFKRKKASAISGNTFFHWEVLKHEPEAMQMCKKLI